jgi:glycosyltransferase involved in cell wall biosynthesis
VATNLYPVFAGRRDIPVVGGAEFRQSILARAFALPQYRFRMIGGEGGYDADAHAYYETIRAEAVPNLEFMGFLPVADVEPHFDEARVFVNTSEHEGFPNTFLQAWARGVPTVSYFDAGVREDGSRPFVWVTDGNGAVNAVSTLLGDLDQWQALSDVCRNHFLEFHSVESTVRAYDGIFNSLSS